MLPIHTLSRYSLVRVSILMVSPLLTKKGTLTFKPVSKVAGFVPPVAVSPFTPGGVSITFNSTFGFLTYIGFIG